MSLQTTYFGKRPADLATSRPAQNQPAGMVIANAGGAGNAAAPASAPVLSGAPAKEGGSQLTVGPNIKLKGVEITDCDTLVVEGTVEATMDSRVMHITEIGAFKGSAEVDFAEIHGAFNGDLTVRDKLVIYATGRVNGKIRYGKVVIEEGGQMVGDIQFGAASKGREMPATKMSLLSSE
jgi:cytoskeletal protein CcmA (bactofilin family)